jgi:hypothetical protein
MSRLRLNRPGRSLVPAGFWAMALPQDERVMRLRRLARQLEASPPSPERDELLGRTRRRMVEIEAWGELGPPSSLPGLSDEPT